MLWLAVVLSAGLAVVPEAAAQGALMRLNLLGREYEVFRAPQRPSFFGAQALSNRRTVEGLFGPEQVATAVGAMNGVILGYAAAYNPSGGIAFLRDGAKPDEYSVAEDIADDGVMIGWDHAGPPSVTPGGRRPPRAFIYSKASRLQYLDDLFPQVKVLFETRPTPDGSGQLRDRVGTKGISVSRSGHMILLGAPDEGLAGHSGLYRLSPGGALTPFVATSSGLKLNNAGDLPPAETESKDGIRFHNQFVNDRGSVAGTVTTTNANPLDVDSPKIGIHVDGRILPESARTTATSLNNEGAVASDNGSVWDAAGNRVDVRGLLWAAGKDTVFKGQPAFTNGFARGFVNDAGDIVWSDFFLRRICPEVGMQAEVLEGFEFAAGRLVVKVGTRFKAKAMVTNSGGRPLEDVRVELYPPSPLFRQVGDPVPRIPASLAPGASFEAVFEWEPLQSGSYEGSFALHARGECGDYEKLLTPVPILFENSPLGVTFLVEPKPEGTNAIPLCSDFEVVALVTNLTTGTLENVGPISPPTNDARGLVVTLGAAQPAGTVRLAAKASAVFRWPVRAARLGTAPVDTLFTGSRDGAPFRVGPAQRLEITVGRTDWVVNRTGDESDADTADVCPDVDSVAPGLQTTLRAALEAANAVAGAQKVRFEVAGSGTPILQPSRPLPTVTNEVEVLGTTQPGGWVEVSGTRFSSTDGTPLWESKGGLSVRGLAFVAFTKGSVLRFVEGRNRVAGCRFGWHADGSPAESARAGIHISGGTATVGGAGSADGNAFRGGRVGIAAFGLNAAVGPSGLVIEGNRFGTTGSDGSTPKTGPENAVVFYNVRNSRVGGLTEGARNRFAGSKAAALMLAGPECAENTILGNWFGLTEKGTKLPLGEFNGYGIAIVRGAHHNRVGGIAPGSGNVISGSDDAGVIATLGAHDNVIEGNRIGTTPDGGSEAGNEFGVWLLAGANNRVGGSIAGARNLISGNFRAGVFVGRPDGWKSSVKDEDPGDEPSAGSVIEGNWIGVDASGSRALPNGRTFRLEGMGVAVGRLANDTVIGGVGVARHNVISGNEGAGVVLDVTQGTRHGLFGNRIGLASDGAAPVPNRGPGLAVKGDPQLLLGGVGPGEANVIAGNTGVGVDLIGLIPGARAVPLAGNLLYRNLPRRSIALASRRVPNDDRDADAGANGLQNWPVILGAYNRDGVTRVVVDLGSFKASTGVQVDLFRAADGGGDLRLLTTNLMVGSSPGNRFALLAPLQPVGSELTALATTSDGTSEFAPPVPVVSGVDTDGDGIPDALEREVPVLRGGRALQGLAGGNGVPAAGDLNGDGVADELQAHVASVRIPDSQAWITVVASPGRRVTDLIGLRTGDVPSLPPGWRVVPGAVRFTLDRGAGSSEALQLWLPAQTASVSLWRGDGGRWIWVGDAVTRQAGGSTVATCSLPARDPGSEWMIAAAVEAEPLASPSLTVLPQRVEIWPDLATLGSSTLDAETLPGPISGVRLKRVQPVRVTWPVDGAGLRLETSPDLVIWDEVPVWPVPGEVAAEYAWPAEEPARFFRFRQD